MSLTTSAGVLYVATGPRHLAEVVGAARSVRTAMPAVPVALLCDAPDRLGGARTLFDHVLVLEGAEHGFRDKIRPLGRSPFARTLFLDTDTLVVESVDELFPLLDRFELAMAHAPWRENFPVPECPASFPQMNTGVILYRNDERVGRFLEAWDQAFVELRGHPGEPGPPNDQASFRRALFASDLRFLVLTPEYNLRTPFPAFAGGNAPVKILHGRFPSRDRAREALACSRRPRVWDPAAEIGVVRRLVRRLGRRLSFRGSRLHRAAPGGR